MFDRILKQFQDLLLARRYVITLHAYDEMGADDFSVWDVESAFLNGTVEECQRDRQTAERKYRIAGTALDGRGIEVVAKLGPTGKLVIITVYAL